jgi:hypothetical protein
VLQLHGFYAELDAFNSSVAGAIERLHIRDQRTKPEG